MQQLGDKSREETRLACRRERDCQQGWRINQCMSDDPDYILDISGMHDEPAGDACSFASTDEETCDAAGRRWIGVHFECCGIYTRIYRNADATAYQGFCPKCNRAVKVAVGPNGTSTRLFRAN